MNGQPRINAGFQVGHHGFREYTEPERGVLHGKLHAKPVIAQPVKIVSGQASEATPSHQRQAQVQR